MDRQIYNAVHEKSRELPNVIQYRISLDDWQYKQKQNIYLTSNFN
jgi:hypothetical protein